MGGWPHPLVSWDLADDITTPGYPPRALDGGASFVMAACTRFADAVRFRAVCVRGHCISCRLGTIRFNSRCLGLILGRYKHSLLLTVAHPRPLAHVAPNAGTVDRPLPPSRQLYRFLLDLPRVILFSTRFRRTIAALLAAVLLVPLPAIISPGSICLALNARERYRMYTHHIFGCCGIARQQRAAPTLLYDRPYRIADRHLLPTTCLFHFTHPLPSIVQLQRMALAQTRSHFGRKFLYRALGGTLCDARSSIFSTVASSDTFHLHITAADETPCEILATPTAPAL